MGEKPIFSVRDLEDLLDDQSADPKPIPYTLIQTITGGFTKRVGSGGYGDVHLGVLGKDKKVAVKELVYTQTDEVGTDEVLKQEIACFMKAKHQNIARLVGYSADIAVKMAVDTYGDNSFTGSRKRYLCLEYAPCGDLQAYIEGRSLQQTNTEVSDGDDWTTYYQIILGICQGLKHIHEQHIIHLDIKPKNILLDAYMQAKITDFGVSKSLEAGQSTAIVRLTPGTAGFKAPEMETRKEVSYKSDIYALGATIARLLMRNNSEDVQKWLANNSLGDNCPEEKKTFIDIARKCMKDDPDERITLQEIIGQLKEMGLEDSKRDESEDVIKVVPHEMPFRPFDQLNVVSSTLNLVNRTGLYVAYKISRKGSGKEHRTGIIEPRSTHTIDMPREVNEPFQVQSTVVTNVMDKEEFPADLFEMVLPGRRIYKVDVVEAPPQPTPLEGFNRSQINAGGALGDTSSQVMQSSTMPLDVHPSELHIPFESNKAIPCQLYLTNKTDRLVMFRLSVKGWFMDYISGIVPPRSTCTLVLIAKKQKTIPKKRYETEDIITLLCDFYNEDLEATDYEHSVNLKVVYTPQGEMTYEVSFIM